MWSNSDASGSKSTRRSRSLFAGGFPPSNRPKNPGIPGPVSPEGDEKLFAFRAHNLSDAEALPETNWPARGHPRASICTGDIAWSRPAVATVSATETPGSIHRVAGCLSQSFYGMQSNKSYFDVTTLSCPACGVRRRGNQACTKS